METNPTFTDEERAILASIPGIEGGGEGDTVDKADGLPDAPAPTPAPTPAPEPTAAPVESSSTRAALRAARHQEKRLREELARKDQELEQLRSGKTPPSTAISDEEIEESEADFPLQGKVARKLRELENTVQQLRQTQTPPEFVPIPFRDDVQVLVDEVPDLLAWQHDPNAQDKLQAAIAQDKALQADPAWAGRPVVERFAEAARLVKTTPTAAPAATRKNPADVIAGAPVEGPKGISDFRGGGPASAPAKDFRKMSDEEIMASLPVTE